VPAVGPRALTVSVDDASDWLVCVQPTAIATTTPTTPIRSDGIELTNCLSAEIAHHRNRTESSRGLQSGLKRLQNAIRIVRARTRPRRPPPTCACQRLPALSRHCCWMLATLASMVLRCTTRMPDVLVGIRVFATRRKRERGGRHGAVRCMDTGSRCWRGRARPAPATTVSRLSADRGAGQGVHGRDVRTRRRGFVPSANQGAPVCPSRPKQQRSARSGLRFRRSNSLSCVAGLPRCACLPGSLLPIGRRAYSWRRSRRSRVSGRRSTTGARARRD
jgi:hypothetical protein